jgi:hypothetical protein
MKRCEFYWILLPGNTDWEIGFLKVNGTFWVVGSSKEHLPEDIKIDERPIIREEPKPKFENLYLP